MPFGRVDAFLLALVFSADESEVSLFCIILQVLFKIVSFYSHMLLWYGLLSFNYPASLLFIFFTEVACSAMKLLAGLILVFMMQ